MTPGARAGAAPLAGVVVLLLLGGCVANPFAPVVVEPGPAAAAEPAPEPEPEPAGPTPEELARLALEKEADPGRLGGMAATALTDWLGEPHFVRRDPPAQLWQYRGEACVLDLFLYGTNSAVTHWEVRPRGEKNVTAKGCLMGLLEAQRDGGKG